MELPFSNRRAELRELNAAARSGGLVVLFGRRRVGKTRLLTHWLESRNGLYSQAIEAGRDIQIEQIFRDIRDGLATEIVPRTWAELFELLDLRKKRWTLCLDEFPYLVASDASLPSVVQRWIDHSKDKRNLLILCGSSTRMMNDLVLNRAAPLYGRARKIVPVRPMSYGAFCRACHLNPVDAESFTRFSLVGGIPRYWEFVEPSRSAIGVADELFFGFAPYMDQEPARILRDEGIAGVNALSLLETIGRGAEKPSEIAARMGTAQTNLSRVLQQLLDASILQRELPFGESTRSTKRTYYRIQDPSLRFWFRVYSPHRSRWRSYGVEEKTKLMRDHAATVFEDFCRERYQGAARYWEGDLEFDFVRSEGGPGRTGRAIVSEVKWKRLSARERREVEQTLTGKWERCALRKRYAEVEFEVLDAGVLKHAR